MWTEESWGVNNNGNKSNSNSNESKPTVLTLRSGTVLRTSRTCISTYNIGISQRTCGIAAAIIPFYK